MTTRLCHTIASLSLFLIIAALCHCAPLEKLRDKRDTRDLPSNLFRPLDSRSSDTNPRVSPPRNANSTGTIYVQTAAEAHASPGLPELNVVSRPFDDEVYRELSHNPARTQGISSRFGSPMGSNFNIDEDLYEAPFGYGVRPRNGFAPPSYASKGFSGQTYGSPVPLSYQRQSPFPSSRDSSPSNFYRSESYSYNSDGSGPPQIEQSVYDSRMGHGITVKGF